MNSHLVITVAPRETSIAYVVDGHSIVSHAHPVGLKHIEIEGMNKEAASKFIDGVMYTLEFISLHDRIPTHFTLVTPAHATWLGEALESASYTQFYTDGAPVSVTLKGIQDVPLSYARHSQTILSFKV